MKNLHALDLVVRCMAKREGNVWVASCLDFSLAVQGDSLSEAKQKLAEQIVYYVDEALEDKEFGPQLLRRRAPLQQWIEYYLARFIGVLKSMDTLAFEETMPLRVA
jgi:predicted RNase H-like HicB family nuclease